MCLTPIIIWNTKERVRKSTFENAELDLAPAPAVPRREPIYQPSSVVDHHLPFRLVPCGKCVECAAKRKNDWYVRLRRQIECAAYKKVYWVTLTFSDEYLPDDIPTLSHLMRNWKDVLRKRYGYLPDHWFITERGEDDNYTKRLHLHGFLMFQKDRPSYDAIKSTWKYGFVWVQELTSLKAITYSMKYVFKNAMRRLRGDAMVSKVYVSHGIGAAALNANSYRFMFGVNNEYKPYETFGGKYVYWLPRYLLDKLYILNRAKPEQSPQSMLKWLLGDPPDRCSSLLEWCTNRMNKLLRNMRYSYSRRLANVYQAAFELVSRYQILQQQFNLHYV